MEKTTISVIIINFNTAQLTFDCINSIKKLESNKNIEFIIVDNASRAEDYNTLKDLLSGFDQLQLVRSKVNLGFGAGNMLGYQYASGAYLAFINSDVLFTMPVFDELMAFMKNHPQVGVCAPQILDENRQESISFRHFEGIRYKLLGKKFLELTAPGKPSPQKKYTEPIEVDFVLGSFMFFKTTAFEAVGGFDINIFLYYEEADICQRLKNKGYQTFFIPLLNYIHLEGKSSKEKLHLKLEHLLSYFYVTRKNYGFLKYFIIKNYLILAYAFKAPFKKKNRFIFKNIAFRHESLSKSLRHQVK